MSQYWPLGKPLKHNPYPGVPKKYWAKLDRCVDKVMKRKDFKPRKGQTRKQSAIAICRSSLKI
ncbi:MAG: hypothetical protein DRP08_04150 [Candidatus Aenigmatarchaeota archaeon]|nr:MAG: hypothetical protein DRP08_04150 [Candidatus Aenigmarchaeota archaeon]